MEYISKDDAKVLIEVLNMRDYSLDIASKYLGIVERLQAYIDQPDNLQIKMVSKDEAEEVKETK